MQITLPYNEILPTKKAHDLYLFQEAFYLAEAGAQVTLLSGRGGYKKEALFHHYALKNALEDCFHLHKLPILRKNNPLALSWNFPFFFSAQHFLKKTLPEVVILSVFKQGEYHLARKLPSILYVYEVHELKFYPGENYEKKEVERERRMLEKADLIIVTTQALASLLKTPPYNLKNPVYCLPLASNTQCLPPALPSTSPLFAYVGQLYKGQGIDLLLQALALAPHARLRIIGGKPPEVEHYKRYASHLSVQDRIEFLGFRPPSQLPSLVQGVDAFIAPFEPLGKMPYVAHVKLIEYIRWGKPIIAPALEVVREHFPDNRGVHLFEAGNFEDLAKSLREINLAKLQQEILPLSSHYSWQGRAKNYLEILRGCFSQNLR